MIFKIGKNYLQIGKFGLVFTAPSSRFIGYRYVDDFPDCHLFGLYIFHLVWDKYE